jgi:Domain of unknown function (DUF4926)
MTSPKLLDPVALLHDLPANRLTLVESDYATVQALPAGLIGTIVEVYPQETEPQYLVEFADAQGCEYAMAVLKQTEILVLHPILTVA